jgi:hypothetical protein
VETTLHRQLKACYGSAPGGRTEVVLTSERVRIDAVAPDGELVEIQAAPLGALRGKVGRLLSAGFRVRVVKPLVLRRRIVRRASPLGPDLGARLSPRRGRLDDLFDDLVGLARLFPRPGLTIEVLPVHIDEVRVPQRRRSGFEVVDRRLSRAEPAVLLEQAGDLWALLPRESAWTGRFTTLDLARRLDRPVGFAQRVAYCLRLSGAAIVVGKVGNRRVYERVRQ